MNEALRASRASAIMALVYLIVKFIEVLIDRNMNDTSKENQ